MAAEAFTGLDAGPGDARNNASLPQPGQMSGSVVCLVRPEPTWFPAARSAPGADRRSAPAPWRKARAVRDPGKILLDVALAVALGGDCLADVATCGPSRPCSGRWPPARPSPGSSAPSQRTANDKRALAAIRAARVEVREPIWQLAGEAAPDAGGRVTGGLDGVLLLAHSEKQDSAATWKKTFGHHPLMGFVDHGRGGSGEPVVDLLQPGHAGRLQQRRRPH